MGSPFTMTVTADELARVMFKARCDECGMTEEEGWLITGEGYEQYLEEADKIADWINEYEPEALAIAQFLIDRNKVSAFFID